MDFSQKGTIHPIALAAFIIIVVFVGGVYLLYSSGQFQRGGYVPTPTPTSTYTSGPYISNKPTPSPLPTQPPKPSASSAATAGWKTYTNGMFGFSLQYPPNLQVKALGANQAKASLDTINFAESTGKFMWSLDIFAASEWIISESSFLKEQLYIYSNCDIRKDDIYSQDLHMLSVQGTPILEAAVTFDVKESASVDVIRVYKDCYYLKNLANNLLVFNLSSGSRTEFATNNILIQRALNTLQFTQ
jgi:hypothetical protein